MVGCAFEDAGNGCGIESGGGDHDGELSEGKLADSRLQEAEASMPQPASKQDASKRKGVIKQEAVAPGKPVVHREIRRWRLHD
jgi:hypothetical protein